MSKYGNAIEAGDFYDGAICSDCTSALANGDTSGNSEEWNEAKYLETLAEYDVNLGAVHSGPYAHSCWHSPEACEDDCTCTRTELSPHPCDMCGTDDEGTRESVVMVRRSLLA